MTLTTLERIFALRPLAVAAVAHFNKAPTIDPLRVLDWSLEHQADALRATDIDDPPVAMLYLIAAECDRRFDAPNAEKFDDPDLAAQLREFGMDPEGMPARIILPHPEHPKARLYRGLVESTRRDHHAHIARLERRVATEKFRAPLPVGMLAGDDWKRLLEMAAGEIRGRQTINPDEMAEKAVAKYPRFFDGLSRTAALLGTLEAITQVLEADQPSLKQIQAIQGWCAAHGVPHDMILNDWITRQPKSRQAELRRSLDAAVRQAK